MAVSGGAALTDKHIPGSVARCAAALAYGAPPYLTAQELPRPSAPCSIFTGHLHDCTAVNRAERGRCGGKCPSLHLAVLFRVTQLALLRLLHLRLPP